MSLIAHLPEIEKFLSHVQPLRINGSEVAGTSELDVINPSSRAVLCRITAAEPEQIDLATTAARLFVHQSVHDQVLDGLRRLAEGLSVGPGTDKNGHDLGPVISQPQMDKVIGYVTDGLPAGAE